MGEKFQNRYRIPSARLKNWDYRSKGLYYITICCHRRVHHFGEVHNGRMVLSGIGEICDKYLKESPAHFPFVVVDAAVVMPDHLHAILMIDGDDGLGDIDIDRDVACNVCTPDPIRNAAMAAISPQYGSLASVVRSFKSAVSKEAHLINAGFRWHARFHDSIIRDEDEHLRIKKYIDDNPRKWGDRYPDHADTTNRQ